MPRESVADPMLAEWLGLNRPANNDAPRPSSARTLADCLSDPTLLEAPAVLVPHIAIAGRCTLLSGREKSGKSTLTAQLVADASRSRAVLGAPIAASVTTLWYAVDERLGDAVRRFDALDADPNRVIVNDEPRTVADLLAHLAADLVAYPDVSLVVVDTLSRLFSTVKTNASDQVEPLLWRLVDALRQHDRAAVLLYHTGKSGTEYRGSTAIGATVDEILTLRRKGEQADDFDAVDDADDGRRVLVQQGRNLSGRVQLAYHAGRYRLLDEVHPPRERILAALEDGPATNRSDLVARAKVKKADGLAEIRALIAAGEIVETHDGLSLAASPQSIRVPALPRFRAHGNPSEPVAGSEFPSVPPAGTPREPRVGTGTSTREARVPESPPLVGGKWEPVLDEAV